MFDVGTLLEDAETKTAALERVEELEENLGTVRQTGGETDRSSTNLSVLECLLDMKEQDREKDMFRDRQI